MPQRIPARIELKPAQQKVLASLHQTGAVELTRGMYEALTGVSRSQAAYDVAELVAAGILERIGGGRSTRYRLVERREPSAAARRWTRERIGAELERFCAGRATWPTAREFKRAGRTDLYVAVSRYGGVRSWAAALGLPRGPAAALPRPRLGRTRRWSWAGSGAAIGALVVGLAVAVFHPWTSGRPQASAPRVTVVEERSAAPAGAARRAATRRRHQQAHVRRTQTPPQARAASASGATRVAQVRATDVATDCCKVTAPARASSAPSTVRVTRVTRVARSVPSPSTSSRPTPLVAPDVSSAAPEPLPAP